MAYNANNGPQQAPLSVNLISDIPVAKQWLVAYSGGIDSTVLLHLLATLPQRPRLRAIHINHQLSPRANDWQQHAESFCNDLNVECLAVKVELRNQGRGLEDAAREARYQVFEKHLQPDEVLLLAHHQNDQAETLLLRLLRGAGVRGMAAMPAQRKLGEGQLSRPLLNTTRAQIERYAEQHGLQWVEDDSNTDTQFDRNYLRASVLPLIDDRWPGYAHSWSHTATTASEAAQLLAELAQSDLPGLDLRSEAYGISIKLAATSDLSDARLRNALQTVFSEHGFKAMPRAQMQQFIARFLQAGADATPQIDWSTHQARRFRDRVYFLRELPAVNTGFESRHPGGAELIEIAGHCTIEIRWAQSMGIDAGQAGITIRFRQGGERLAVSDSMTKTLKNWLQEQAVPPWIRDRLPLIFLGPTLCAVADRWHDEDIIQQVRVQWHNSSQ